MSKAMEGQISLFDLLGGTLQPVTQMQVTDMTETYLEEAVMRSSGLEGKKRIYELYQKDMSASERAKAIKDGYGIGGAGWPIDDYGLHGYDSYHGGGFHIEWRDETGEHDKVFTWSQVEQMIHKLVDSGKYYQPPKKRRCAATNEDCNHENCKQVAIECLDIDCKAECCQACTEVCGARCNYSAHQPKKLNTETNEWVEVKNDSLPCDDCIFGSPGGCEYNTRNCYCVNGDKQIRQDSGWKLVDKGKNLPPCTGNWQDYDVLVYYAKADEYAYEVWEYKDWTFRGKDKYDASKGSATVVAWRKQEAEDHDYSRYIAEELIEHCHQWGYDWIEKLKEDKTVENFYRIFCKITKTYYFHIGADYYGVNFSKDGSAEVYKCGKNHEHILRTVSIQEIVDKLPSKGREKNQCLGEPCASCDVEWCSIKCFERRGYMWDRFNRFVKDEKGNKLRKALKDRECKKDYE